MSLPIFSQSEARRLLTTPILSMEDCLRYCEFLKYLTIQFFGHPLQQQISAWVKATNEDLVKEYRENIKQGVKIE